MFDYWRAVSERLECPEIFLVAQINRQAVVDFLCDTPNALDRKGDLALAGMHRHSAYVWLFSDEGKFGTLGYLCKMFGPPVDVVRVLILQAAFEHIKINMAGGTLDTKEEPAKIEQEGSQDNGQIDRELQAGSEWEHGEGGFCLEQWTETVQHLAWFWSCQGQQEGVDAADDARNGSPGPAAGGTSPSGSDGRTTADGAGADPTGPNS